MYLCLSSLPSSPSQSKGQLPHPYPWASFCPCPPASPSSFSVSSHLRLCSPTSLRGGNQSLLSLPRCSQFALHAGCKSLAMADDIIRPPPSTAQSIVRATFAPVGFLLSSGAHSTTVAIETQGCSHGFRHICPRCWSPPV